MYRVPAPPRRPRDFQRARPGPGVIDRTAVQRWLDSYETAWRAPGSEGLGAVFTIDATYLHSPYAEPVVGLPAIAAMWEADRAGPEEVFSLSTDIVAVDGQAAVVRAL